MHLLFPPLTIGNRRSAVALCALVALGAASLGYPVVRPVAKDLSTPFPCQHRGCGCRDAQACWKNCCCFSTAEKLAWAKAQNVTPPVELAHSDLATRPAADSRPTSHRGGCCSQATRRRSPPSAGATACATATITTASATAATDAAATSWTVELVLSEAARQCGGLGPLLLLLSQALLAPRVAPPTVERPWVVDVEIADSLYIGWAESPGSPPPRSHA